MAAFGTSGLRGLVEELDDRLVYRYVRAFLRYLEELREFAPGSEVILGGDLRPSTPVILEAAWAAVVDAGGEPRFAGYLPTPALALAGFTRQVPSLMVTGSHIPFDRNGIKFNRVQGELGKADEAGILAHLAAVPEPERDECGSLRHRPVLPAPESSFTLDYLRRYRDCLDSRALAGLHIGIYQHSGVARDLLETLLAGFGAQVILLGRTEDFVPMDTEALRAEDRERAASWVRMHALDALISTDGDADRPMLADERGNWWRGDLLGLVSARILDADAVVTPVSSNTALERSGFFAHILRTRIGSPYVIAAMDEARAEGYQRIVGYEANGGLLLGSEIPWEKGRLAALPTRDAVLPLLAVLREARYREQPLSSLLDSLPQRFTSSDRLQDFPTEVSHQRLQRYRAADGCALFGRDFGDLCGGEPLQLDHSDGVRAFFASGDILHLRPSGNAPELRCYTEADSVTRADALLQGALTRLARWRQPEEA
ncbi:phosphomannomutase [Acidithiobacillus caldus]